MCGVCERIWHDAMTAVYNSSSTTSNIVSRAAKSLAAYQRLQEITCAVIIYYMIVL